MSNAYQASSSLKLSFSSDVIMFEQSEDMDFQLYELYQVEKNSPLIVKPVGSWSEEVGLDMTDDSLWERRQNLQGMTFKACVVNVRCHNSDKFINSSDLDICRVHLGHWSRRIQMELWLCQDHNTVFSITWRWP